MVEFNRASLLDAWLLRRSTILACTLRGWRRRQRVSGDRMASSRGNRILQLRYPTLLLLVGIRGGLLCFICRVRSLVLSIRWHAIASLWAEYSFRALNRMLGLLPVAAALRCIVTPVGSHLGTIRKNTASPGDRLDSGPHWCSNTDCIWVVTGPAFNTVPWWQECVEALDKIRVPCKQFRYTVDDSRSVDTIVG